MSPWQLAAAFGLDLIWGDPKWLPHPVCMIGRAVTVLETVLRRWVAPWTGERTAGILLTVVIVLGTYGTIWLALRISEWIHSGVTAALTVYFPFSVLAVKSLGDEARGVFNRLRETDLVSARQWLSRIVGRETGQLSEGGVIRATVESVSENTSDGIIAPLFYLTVGGPALAMAYKAINTLDSMVGYPTPRYRYFGWASARLDDAANYLPARITGMLMISGAEWFFGQGRRTFRIMRRDGLKHDSPNAGIPEAAAAGALGIQLGGPSRFQGQTKEKPWLGDATREPQKENILESIRLMRAASFQMAILCTGLLHMISLWYR